MTQPESALRVYDAMKESMPDSLPPINESLDPLSTDFDEVLESQQTDARAKPIESFAAAPAAADEADDLSQAVDADTSTEAAQTEAIVAAREEPAAPAEPVVEPEKPAKKPRGKAAVETPTPETPATPAAAAPTSTPTLAASDVIAITPEFSLTREQLHQHLGVAQNALKEAKTFSEVFGMSADQATTSWKPIIDGIRQDPTRADFFDAMASAVQNPGKRAYIEKALAYYEAEERAGNVQAPAQPVAPAQPLRDPRVDQILNERRTEQLTAAQNAVNTEWSTLQQRWPHLADEGLRRFVAQRAFAVMQGDANRGIPGDPSYTLTRAAEDLKQYLDRFSPSAPAAAAAPAQEPAAVPALNGSRGASPNGARRQLPPAKSYDTPDDALAAWAERYPDNFPG